MTGTVFLEASNYSVHETNATVTVAFARTGDTSGPVNITFSTNADSATAGADYTTVSGVVTIPAGATRAVVTIPILNDTAAETTETFNLSIISVDSGTLLYPRTARIDILDDENPVNDPPEPPLTSAYEASQQSVLTGLTEPMSFQWSPADATRLFVAEKGGTIKVFDTTTNTQISTFIDLRAEVNNNSDRGLIDMVLDPGFPDQPYIYAFYVVDPPEAATATGLAARDSHGNRYAHVVRIEADPATGFTTAIPGSKTILVGSAGDSYADVSGAGAINSTDDFSIAASDVDPLTGQYVQDYIKVDSTSHAGGSLEFGPDGALYVTIGDGVSFNAVDPRAVSVQDVNALAGKVLRIDPNTGDGLADNPFVQPGMSLDSNAAKVFQMGLRNPYSLTFGPDGRMFIGETGWFTWEEINSGGAGANFGWPYLEGGDGGVLAHTPGYENLPTAAAFFAAMQAGQINPAAPFRAFSHDPSDPGFQFNAIVGADVVYTGNRYPSEFQNTYFFTNIVAGQIFAVDVNDRRDVKYVMNAPSGFGPVHFEQGPDGYLYYADLVSGEIGRFLIAPKVFGVATAGVATFEQDAQVYTLTTNVANQAGAVNSNGRVDLSQNFQVTFDARLGSSDAGGEGIAFALHNDARGRDAVGLNGAGLGIKGIADGIGIEIDTADSGVAGELASDHSGFFDTDTTATFATTPVALANLEDGTWHQMAVRWSAATQTLTYSIDGIERGALTGDLATQYLGGSQLAHFAIGGATGAASNLQQIRHISVSATYEGGTSNQAPELSLPIADQSAASDTAFTLTLPAGTFTDTDAGDSLTLTARQSNGLALPGWLTFDPVTRTFSGTPGVGDNGTLSVEVRATDKFGASAGDTFSINVTGGSSTPIPTFVTNGSASFDTATGVHTLTPALNGLAGTAMTADRVDLRQSFQIAFDLMLGNNNAGADGLAFVLHNDPRGAAALGAFGGGMAVAGIANGIGIELDTWFNEGTINEIVPDHSNFFDPDGSFATPAVDLGDIEDGLFHRVVVRWNAVSKVLSYDFDGVNRGSITSDIVTQFLGGSPFVHLGFGAGTGGAANLHQVHVTAFTGTMEGTPGGVTIEGTAGDDVVTVTSTVAGQPLPTMNFGDLIRGNAGNDSLRGLGGDDTILGGIGNDTIAGGFGRDSLDGGEGNDFVVADSTDVLAVGGAGNDMLILQGSSGAAGIDIVARGFERFYGNNFADVVTVAAATTVAVRLNGVGGDDQLTGGAGADTLLGEAGNDTLVGGLGNDSLTGGAGVDSLSGGDGDDIVLIDALDASYTGGAGSDRLVVTGDAVAGTIDLVALGFEKFTGSGGADIVTGSAAATIGITVVGYGGDDQLTGGSRQDVIFGGIGNDRLSGVDGNDTMRGEAGSDTLLGGNGGDRLNGGADADVLTGGLGRDTFRFEQDALIGAPDAITDFTVVDDTIGLSRAAFAAVASNAAGVVLASNVVVGPEATTADQHVIYDAATGALMYDADGNGATAAVRLATLQAGLAITNANFVMF